MYQFDWASRSLWLEEPAKVTRQQSQLGETIQGTMLLQWQEHCVECAVPLCYANCPLYVQRRDRKCARLVYGIVRNRAFPGLLLSGADLRFRRWGKLEAALTGRYVPVTCTRVLDIIDRVLTAGVNTLGDVLSWADPKRRVNGALTLYRGKFLEKLGKRGVAYDEFAVECYSFEQDSCRLIVELRKHGISAFREGLELAPGHNHFHLKIPLPNHFGDKDGYELMVYPDEDKELRVVFSWLDFVVRSAVRAKEPENRGAGATRPSTKVKCVAWDLDNTLWTGVLVEDGELNLHLRPEAAKLIRLLDERGILQTVVSKNHHDEAMAVLARLGLEEFFLYPAINWGRKSENLQQVADRLNINIDTFAVIDDSPFERREVSASLPMVRVYAEDILEDLLDRPEFDVPVTEASRMRRKSYLTEITRDRVKEQFGSDYVDFLRSCQLKLRIFRPAANDEIARCLELIQRSNQLNLSSRRYSADEFHLLLADRNVLCVAMECEDKFGSYGIVGFASIDTGGEAPVAKDFVLSCRVAQKHVEHAFYSWLAQCMKQRGAYRLLVELTKTARNKPLVKVFEELPFAIERSEGDRVLLSLDLCGSVYRDDVVELDDAAFNNGSPIESHSELR